MSIPAKENQMAATGQLLSQGISPRILTTEELCFRATGAGIDATDLDPVNKAGSRYDRRGASQSLYATRGRHALQLELERRAGVPIARFRISVIRVRAVLLDAHTAAGLLSLGLRRGDLVEEDNTICLELADLARDSGCGGLIAPSVVAEEEASIVIWREAVSDAVSVISWTILTTRYAQSTGTDPQP
jgi:hypothetical protein